MTQLQFAFSSHPDVFYKPVQPVSDGNLRVLAFAFVAARIDSLLPLSANVFISSHLVSAYGFPPIRSYANSAPVGVCMLAIYNCIYRTTSGLNRNRWCKPKHLERGEH